MEPQNNPYVPAKPVGKPTGQFKINHSQALNFVFESQSWMQNVLLVTVCMFIPVVGPIVLYGYQFEVVEALHRRRGQGYPDFDFGRFSEYLSRGVWVFLVALVINMVMIPIIWLVVVGGMLLIGLVASSVGPDAAGWSLFMTIPFFVILMVGTWIFMGLIMAPMILRSGLMQDFGQGFNMSFAGEFIRNTWKQMIMSTLFVVLMSTVLSIAGFLALCVGMYVAIAYMTLVMAHLGWQMYELHLSKGGSAIPLKPIQPPMASPPTYR